jgi:hypothetical protein
MTRLLFCSALAALTAAVHTPVPQAQGEKTATQFFLEYRAAFEKAKSMDEILPFMVKERRDDMVKTPAPERKKKFERMQMMSDARNVKVVSETKTDKGVELSVEGVDAQKQKATGRIQVVREGGSWKIAEEIW